MKKLPWNSTFNKLRSRHPVPSLHGKQMGEKWKQWQILFSWAPKSLQMVIAAMKLKQACSLEEKLWQYIKKQRHHFANKSPYRQSYGKVDKILKSRDIIWPTKIHIVRAMLFPVVMYGYKSWTTKKAEHQRIHDFIYFGGLQNSCRWWLQPWN